MTLICGRPAIPRLLLTLLLAQQMSPSHLSHTTSKEKISDSIFEFFWLKPVAPLDRSVSHGIFTSYFSNFSLFLLLTCRLNRRKNIMINLPFIAFDNFQKLWVNSGNFRLRFLWPSEKWNVILYQGFKCSLQSHVVRSCIYVTTLTTCSLYRICSLKFFWFVSK